MEVKGLKVLLLYCASILDKNSSHDATAKPPEFVAALVVLSGTEAEAHGYCSVCWL